MKRTILLDEVPFNENYLPLQTKCRDKHVDQIVSSLDPIRRGLSPRNIYVYGLPGAGKTATVRSILREHFGDMSVYINCWNNATSHKVMSEFLKQTDPASKIGFVHGRESTSELIKRFEQSKKKFIVCLDEADHLKDHDILYVFARNSCPVILISNHSYTPLKMDGRIKSSLNLQEIEFKNYPAEDITQILRDRIALGLNPNSITDDLVAEIASSCGGDARAGIQILKNAAIDAESKGHESITMDHVKAAAGFARKYRLSYLLGKLNDHQKTIYEIIKQNKSMDSGKLFNEYRRRMNGTVTDRSYRNYMARMVELELVRVISSGRWKKYEIMY
ncbi:Cdc6/Cdc18 family protein [Candidatus Nitrosotenuis sp. DW1]|uniref:Cdc6/Cdc18 family protein n=1 Tax=Candidatus Nitrosotenuis sp. DW1 TaxID=2259672 RepID=UPI0015CCBD12|nr:AAA family ATPase [Candidatus Nitrosotenuis sp. DW1]